MAIKNKILFEMGIELKKNIAVEHAIELTKKHIARLIANASDTLKNNYWALKKQKDKEFVIGMYNRFDELGLIYSNVKEISFNEAILELGLQELMEELKLLKEEKE